MREGSTLSWLLSDHLGSTSITAGDSGARSGEVRYRPWGEDRFTWGTTPTSYRYTVNFRPIISHMISPKVYHPFSPKCYQ